MTHPDLFFALANHNELHFVKKAGLVSLHGPDARSFLQKMSTNDLDKLTPEQPLATCFVDSKGKLVDFCLVFDLGDQKLVAVSSHPDSNALLDWLSKYHFIEEFVLTSADNLYSFVWRIRQIPAPTEPALVSGMFVKMAQPKVGLHLELAGQLLSGPCPPSLDQEAWQNLRIACGLPEHPHEINNSFMPQNVGLEPFIASNKGCYIGQEVLAKALLYQKHKKVLIGAWLQEKDFLQAKPGQNIKNSDGKLGTITSLAPSYWPNFINALVVTEAAEGRHSAILPRSDSGPAEFSAPF